MITRAALKNDLPQIVKIYNQAVISTTGTFDIEAKTASSQESWFEQHIGKFALLVAEDAGKVVGWISLKPWSERQAYADTAELAFYVDEGQQGKGFGHQLFKGALIHAREAGLHTVISRISEGSDASLHLHRQYGFSHIGVMKEVGRKFGKLLDVHMMQIIL